MTKISSARLHRVIGAPKRDNLWEAIPQRPDLETVDHNQRPMSVRIMTAFSIGGGLICSAVMGYFLMDIISSLT